MSRSETEMTQWYAKQIGGTLIEEFMAVPRAPGQAQRLLDGLVILGEPPPVGRRPDIRGRDVVVLQAKNSRRGHGRLGMNIAGQVLFSKLLVERMGARVVEAVALVPETDQ